MNTRLIAILAIIVLACTVLSYIMGWIGAQFGAMTSVGLLLLAIVLILRRQRQEKDSSSS